MTTLDERSAILTDPSSRGSDLTALDGTSLFASSSVAVHLTRGVLGFGALTLALAWAPDGWPALLLIPLALWAFRGCPMCWTMGLVQTLLRRNTPSALRCSDGSCRPNTSLRSQ